jgi:hypothetical protein
MKKIKTLLLTVIVVVSFAFVSKKVETGEISNDAKAWVAMAYLADANREESAVMGTVGSVTGGMWGAAAGMAFGTGIGAGVGIAIGL